MPTVIAMRMDFPAAVTALLMPFTYSVANGLAFGFITYAVLKLFTAVQICALAVCLVKAGSISEKGLKRRQSRPGHGAACLPGPQPS